MPSVARWLLGRYDNEFKGFTESTTPNSINPQNPMSYFGIMALSWLLLFVIGHVVTAFDPTPDTSFWVWLEAEEFADTNFPHANRSTRGEFCDPCSGNEYLLFLAGRPGRPFAPPGYWYADYALRVPAPGD